jgi:2OG-Fe(II) oxygenase superfamily
MDGAGPKYDGTISQSVIVVDDFLPADLALAMRRDIETHFGTPEKHTEGDHQVWNYWHVPGLYTYMRTSPERVIERRKVELFMGALHNWSLNVLGFGDISWPRLSMYLPGCRQNVHNDSLNGRFAFVYSLTNDVRKTTGGETIVFREGDLFRNNVGKAGAGPDFFAAIPPKFNRLVIFDDRMPHGVERVDGSMEPNEARFVFHGHIKENGVHVGGALTSEQANAVAMTILEPFCEAAMARIRLYHGPLVLRLDVDPKGNVSSCRVMVDRVVGAERSDIDWLRLRAKLVSAFEAVKYPEASGPSVIMQPVLFGATLFRR